MRRISIKEALEFGRKRLEKNSDSPFLDTEVILANLLKTPKEFLLSHPEKTLSAKQAAKYKEQLKKRRAGWPIAYILGYKDFMGLRFKVGPNVLIPRPETEGLLEMALSVIASKAKQSLVRKKLTTLRHAGSRDDRIFRILDLGTGSGCIAISLALQLKKLCVPAQKHHIAASDISARALQVAGENAKFHKVKISFFKSDLFKKLPEQFDLIIANLPYVKRTDYKKRIQNLKREPKIALTDGSNNWILFQKFLSGLQSGLKANGSAFLEIDPKSKRILALSAKKLLPKSKIFFKKDFAGNFRYAQIIRSQ